MLIGVRAPTSSRDSRAAAAGWCLRVGVAVQCGSLAWLALRHGTAVDTLFLMELERAESTARDADRILALLAILAGVGALVRPWPSAVLNALLFLTLAVCVRVVGGRAFSELAPAAFATRWLAPLALLPLAARSRLALSPARRRSAEWVLRVAVATTFATHGWEAIQQAPHFVNLLIGTLRRWFDTAPPESTARYVLFAIGALDLLVALLLLVARRPLLAGWAVLWGLATAAARTVALGPEFAPESMIRAQNALAPLALWFLWRELRRDDAPPA